MSLRARVCDGLEALIPAFTLAVTTEGGGAVSGNTQSNYSLGTAVDLRAEPAPGWYFQSWSGDAGGTSRTVSVLMDRDKGVVASFASLTLLAVTNHSPRFYRAHSIE